MGAREGWFTRGRFPAVGSDDEVGDDDDGGGAVQEDMTDVDGAADKKRPVHSIRALKPLRTEPRVQCRPRGYLILSLVPFA